MIFSNTSLCNVFHYYAFTGSHALSELPLNDIFYLAAVSVCVDGFSTRETLGESSLFRGGWWYEGADWRG
jgi:hypothetical protein